MPASGRLWPSGDDDDDDDSDCQSPWWEESNLEEGVTGAGKGNLENTGATKSSAVEGRVIGQVKFSISSILYLEYFPMRRGEISDK